MDQPTINSPKSEESAPFEMPPDLHPSEPMGGKAKEENKLKSSESEPAQHSSSMSYVIMIFLILVLAGGGILFSAWKGWISLGGLFESKDEGKVVATSSPQISPAISPQMSASPTSSPQITSNVNDETRKKDLANISKALKNYFLAKSKYPLAPETIKTSDKTSVLAVELAPTYIESLPQDPLSPDFYYGYKSDGQSFELTAVLEDKSDPSGVLTGKYNIYKITNLTVE